MRENPDTTASVQDKSRLVLARERDVAKAEAINTLLVRQIAILPTKVGDPILPFAVGLWNEIRCLLKPEISASALRKATGAYVHSRRYQIAVARPGSARYSLNGDTVEAVSEADRLNAQKKYEIFKTQAAPGEGKDSTNPCPPIRRPK